MKKIVLTGGGTVGHVTLNLLLIPLFLKDGWQVHYIGDKKGVEYQEIQALGADVVFHGIATGKLRRYFSWQNLLDVFKVAFGILQSLFVLLKVRPQALFSKGGFVSVPPVVAAKLVGVPVFIHESDRSMGLANKIAYRFATKMYTTFEPEKGLSKALHVGAVTKVAAQETAISPVPADILAHMDESVPTLLFVGGSGGAKVFNDLISQHREELTARFNIINFTGDASLEELSSRLYRVAYVTDLYLPLVDLADLVVTRGGANTIFELLAMQKPHVIVPLGRKASRGDQLENAQYFEEKGYAKQLLEEELDVTNLLATAERILSEKAAYQNRMAETVDLQPLADFYALLQTHIDKER